MADVDTAKKTGGVIALLPADPGLLVVDSPGAEQADDQHVTLQFLGEDVTDWDVARRQHIVEIATAAAGTLLGPIEARVVGHATFAPGGDNQCAVHLIGDTPDLAPLREAITRECAEELGEDHHPQHEPFFAHATAGYGLTAADLSYAGPVLLDRLVVVLAGDRVEIPIPDRFGEAAREAYALGWAATGGPMTERVRAGCIAAVGWAREHRHEVGVLEATIDLGSLEGTWAQVFQRRADLYAKHRDAIAAVWRQVVAGIDLHRGLLPFVRTLGWVVQESDPTPGDGKTDDTAQARAAADGQARQLLHGIVDPASAEYRALRDAVVDALRDAQAEGVAGTIAITADQIHPGQPFSFDLAFHDAHNELGKLDTYWTDANDWIGKIVNGSAADLGDALARVAKAGGDWGELQAAAQDVLSGADVRAVDTLIDMAMSQSYSRGALALYGREGVESVDFSTAGGGVCPICMDAESKNPWARSEVPNPGLHPHCRCVVTSSDPLESLRSIDLSKYLPGLLA